MSNKLNKSASVNDSSLKSIKNHCNNNNYYMLLIVVVLHFLVPVSKSQDIAYGSFHTKLTKESAPTNIKKLKHMSSVHKEITLSLRYYNQ